MLEWFMEARAPIGIIMFAGMFLAFALRRARARKAVRQFPELAAKLGLHHKPSNHAKGIGTLSGEYQGYQIYVDAEEQRRITVRFESSPGIDFRNYEVSRGAPPGMHSYFSGDKQFDTFFKTRYADDEVASRLSSVKAPRQLLNAFYGSYYRQLKQVNITPHGVSCILDFGNPPHLPASAVEQLLPTMLNLAAVIEPHEP